MILPEVTTLAEARDAIRDLAEEVEKLSNELAWFRRQMFGSKTEHYIPEDDTPSLFPEEMSPESPKEVPTATVAEHERKVRQPNALSEIPADLPREERVIDVPEEEREGMILIGYDESERIAFRTGLYVIHFKRAKYARADRLPYRIVCDSFQASQICRSIRRTTRGCYCSCSGRCFRFGQRQNSL